MKYFLFGIASAISVLALPPLPPLPPLSSFSAASDVKASTDKSAVSVATKISGTSQSSSVATTESKEVQASRLPPIMIDSKDSGQKLLTPDDEASRAKNIDAVLKSISDIESQVSAFQRAEQEVDTLYASVQKKLDDFFMNADGFIGQTTFYVQDLSSDLTKKDSHFKKLNGLVGTPEMKKNITDGLASIESTKKGIEELTALLDRAKERRGELGREEDAARQKVVEFKKNTGDISSIYAQAVSAKNAFLVSDTDGTSVVGLSGDFAKKASDFVDSLKAKDFVVIKDALKKIETIISEADASKNDIQTKLESLKKIVTAIGKAEDDFASAQIIEDLKKVEPMVEKTDVQKASSAKDRSSLFADPVVDQDQSTQPRANIWYEVVATIQQGVQLLMSKAHDLFTIELAKGMGFVSGKSTPPALGDGLNGGDVPSVNADLRNGVALVKQAEPVDLVPAVSSVKLEDALAPLTSVSQPSKGELAPAVSDQKIQPKIDVLPKLPDLRPVTKPL